MDLLEIKHISSGYSKKQVLFDITFSVKEGDIVLLVGANGSGKSTLLKTIYSLIKPYTKESWLPEIKFNGDEITALEPSSLIRKGLVYVPQKDSCFENLNIEDNLRISGSVIDDKDILENRLVEVYKLFPILKDFRKKLPLKMSGGEKQMVALGMALVHKPKMILLDEPTLNLSPTHVNSVIRTLKKINEQNGVTILLVEHKLREALKISTKVIGLKHGKIQSEQVINSDFNESRLKELFI